MKLLKYVYISADIMRIHMAIPGWKINMYWWCQKREEHTWTNKDFCV